MFISEEDSNSRLQRSAELESRGSLTVQEHQFRGRQKNASNLPDFLRPIIGASARLSGIRETQEAFGIKSTAGPWSMARGKTSPNGTVDEKVLSKVDSIVGDAQEKAAEKLIQALGLITPEKLENTKARDLSGIAADMSRIIEKTSPKSTSLAGANIVIYAPSQKNEDFYEVIEVGKKEN